MTCAKTVTWLTSAVTRLTSVAWIILSGFAIDQLRTVFTPDEYILDGDTLYIPLEVCTPTSIVVKGQSIGLDNAIPQCGTIIYFYDAIVVSLIVSDVCLAAYLFFGVLATHQKCCSMKPSVAYGMGAFTVFPLIQSAILLWMLYRLAEDWIDEITPYLDNLDVGGVAIKTVRYSGNMKVILSTAGLALALCLFMLVDAMETICCSVRRKNWKSRKGSDRPPPEENEEQNPATNEENA